MITSHQRITNEHQHDVIHPIQQKITLMYISLVAISKYCIFHKSGYVMSKLWMRIFWSNFICLMAQNIPDGLDMSSGLNNLSSVMAMALRGKRVEVGCSRTLKPV